MATLAHAHRFPTVLPLILANAVPIIGVLFFDWSLLSIMFAYWLETGVVAFYSVFKIVKVGGPFQLLPAAINLTFVGIFMRFHLIMIVAFFGPPHQRDFLPPDVIKPLFLQTWPTAVGLFVSHGVSFFVNFLGRREYEHTTIKVEQLAPWNRVVLMHLTTIFGGWVILLTHAPVGGLIVLAIFKIVVDVHAHLRQRPMLDRDASRASTPVPVTPVT